GRLGSFEHPDRIDFRNQAQLQQWRDGGRLSWNTEYKPLFYRDIWPILYRPDQFRFLCDILAQSNYPHDQEQRGLFDPNKLSVVPKRMTGRKREDAAHEAQVQAGLPPTVEFASVAKLAPQPQPHGDDEHAYVYDPFGPLRRYL